MGVRLKTSSKKKKKKMHNYISLKTNYRFLQTQNANGDAVVVVRSVSVAFAGSV